MNDVNRPSKSSTAEAPWRLAWQMAGYAQHRPTCGMRTSKAFAEGTAAILSPCTCGLQELIEAARVADETAAALPCKRGECYGFNAAIARIAELEAATAVEPAAAPALTPQERHALWNATEAARDGFVWTDPTGRKLLRNLYARTAHETTATPVVTEPLYPGRRLSHEDSCAAFFVGGVCDCGAIPPSVSEGEQRG